MKRLNVRVYGLVLDKELEHILVSKETIMSQKIVKFPGGGLEFSEGTIDCLKREFQEELNIAISVEDHFYTTDFFQKSAFDDSQVISIYYFATLLQDISFPFDNGSEFFDFLSLKELKNHIHLPIDRIVSRKLVEKFVS